MLVKHWMSQPVITVAAGDTAQRALERIRANNIDAVVVVSNGRLVGLLGEAELQRASAREDLYLPVEVLPEAIASKPVETYMVSSPPTIPVDYTMEEAADLMLKNRIKTLPVIDHRGVPVGIVTRSDVLKVVIALTGVARKGIQYALQVEDRPRSIQDITDAIRSYGGRMVSILTLSKGAPTGYRKAYIRMYGIDRFKLRRLNETLAHKAKVLYVLEKPEISREARDDQSIP
jgi:acetoin utilization protein AcuB